MKEEIEERERETKRLSIKVLVKILTLVDGGGNMLVVVQVITQ